MTSSHVLAIVKLQHEKVRISVKNRLMPKIFHMNNLCAKKCCVRILLKFWVLQLQIVFSTIWWVAVSYFLAKNAIKPEELAECDQTFSSEVGTGLKTKLHFGFWPYIHRWQVASFISMFRQYLLYHSCALLWTWTERKMHGGDLGARLNRRWLMHCCELTFVVVVTVLVTDSVVLVTTHHILLVLV